MKILYFSNQYGATTTTFIRNEVLYFKDHFNVKYLCGKLDGEPENFIKLIPYQPNRVFRKLKWWLWKADLLCDFYDASYAKKINNFLEEYQPDVIHCHFAYEALTLLDNIDVKKHAIIVHFHGYDASQMLRKKSYVKKLKKYLSLPNIFSISCNQFFAEKLAELTKVPSGRFHLLRYGINLDFFQPEEQSSEKGFITFLQVSSLAEKKGHEITFTAFARVLRNNEYANARLIVTGAGKRMEILRSLARELCITENVIFKGNVAPEEARSLMSKANVFVHHSITSEKGDMEGIPNAIIEAMAMNLPVVSTWHSGIPELVTNGVNGILVKENDIEGMAKAMMRAAEMNIGILNRRKVMEEYNLEDHNKFLEELYLSLTINHRTSIIQ